jgi:hypothetical protein
MCVGSRISVGLHLRARVFNVRVFVANVCVRRGAVCGLSWRGGDVRQLLLGPTSAFAVGVTWTSRTMTAPWAARHSHTSVVDAAGAIYVIGGIDIYSGDTDFNDVWLSTHGGARPDVESGRVMPQGVMQGVLGRYLGVLSGTQEYSGVLEG